MTSYPVELNNTVVKAYEEGFPLLMPRWGYVASAFTLFLIGFFGFFLNLMVILLMFKDRKLWTPLNVILFNLVCSDFSVSVLGNPLTLISSLYHRWIFGRTMCVLYGFFMALLGITSITTLTVISFERYLMVTRPLSARHLSSKGAVLSIVFIWSYSLALTTPPLMGWGNYVNEAANIRVKIKTDNIKGTDLNISLLIILVGCSVNWHEQSMNTLTYIMFLFAMGQVVPLGVITFSYVNIIRTLKQNSQRLGRVSRAEARATAMVFIMIVAFTVAWTPYSLFALVEQFATENIVSPGAGVIPALVAKSSICYNPLIYVGMNTQFRQSIMRVFGIHTKNKNSPTEKFNNTLMSPAHKLSSLNNSRLPSPDTSTHFTKIARKPSQTEETSEASNNDTLRPITRNQELGTILENKSVSERSSELAYDDEPSAKQNDVFGESCKDENGSPILTYDSGCLLFTKCKKDLVENVYGNVAFETDPSDEVIIENEFSLKKPTIIQQSCSLDLTHYTCERKKRKLSVETKMETLIQPKGFFKDAFGKIFDHDGKGRDSFRSYLCENTAQKDDNFS